MCLAQGHNTVTPVGLEPSALGLESSTLPLSHCAPSNYCCHLIKKKVEALKVDCTVTICACADQCVVKVAVFNENLIIKSAYFVD